MAVQNRRDQVLAYRFLLRRRHAALLTGDPDSPEAPLRKLSTATFASIMVATLAAAAAGVMGVLSPGHSTSWRDPKVIIFVKETGSRFIYDPTPAPPGSPPALHQVLNYTSARLLLSGSGWKTVSVSERSLADTPRAADVGIVGAPDDLPSPSGVRTGPWTVCSLPTLDAGGQAKTLTQVTIGSTTGSAVGTGPARPLGDQGLVAEVAGTYWLVWHGHRFQIGDPAAPQNADTPARVLTFLGWNSGQAVPVSEAWLDSLTALPPLTAPKLDNGTPPDGMTVNGQKVTVGQLVKVPAQNGVADRLFVATAKGFAPVDNMQYQLLATATDLKPQEASPQDVGNNQIDASAVSSGNGQWPQTPPALVNSSVSGTVAPCAATTSGSDAMSVSVTPTIPGRSTCYRLPPQARPTTFVADCVTLAPGAVAVVRNQPNPGITAAVYLVSGNGEYAAKDSLGADPATTLKALGYGNVVPAAIPQSVLSLLPDGPTLTADLARQAVVPPPPGPAPTSVAGS